MQAGRTASLSFPTGGLWFARRERRQGEGWIGVYGRQARGLSRGEERRSVSEAKKQDVEINMYMLFRLIAFCFGPAVDFWPLLLAAASFLLSLLPTRNQQTTPLIFGLISRQSVPFSQSLKPRAFFPSRQSPLSSSSPLFIGPATKPTPTGQRLPSALP